MNTEFLKEYVVLADSGSFTAAAAKLHITQSTLSKHIASLEHELDVDLFARDKRGILLTRAGVAYYHATMKTLAALHDAETAAREADAGTGERVIADHDDAPDAALRTLCHIARSRFSLTPLETGAFILYLENRGFTAIQAELGIDRDALADTLASVYRKLGVNDKQAALDAVYSISE